MKDNTGKVKDIVNKDPRYTVDAYLFVLAALQYTRQELQISGHVTGQQLLSGIKTLGLEHYGAMAKLVFEHWGVTKTVDFGNIVINMVNEKILSKTPEDSIDDFKDVYDFDDVFVKEYRVDFRKAGRKTRQNN
jgi:uncharacterized repeat protein (TIGR04138 family)